MYNLYYEGLKAEIANTRNSIHIFLWQMVIAWRYPMLCCRYALIQRYNGV